jgi:hypothetical protein
MAETVVGISVGKCDTDYGLTRGTLRTPTLWPESRRLFIASAAVLAVVANFLLLKS